MMALCLIAAAAPAAAATACNFYVRAGFVPTGQTADGLTPATAFATIKAGAKLAQPGQVVCVGPGLYLEGDLSPDRDGAPGAPGMPDFPIVLHGDPSGTSTGDAAGAVQLMPPTGLPAIDTPSTAFLLAGRRQIVIEGFEMSGYADAGIQVRALDASFNSADITLRDNVIRNCRSGIDVHGEGTMVVEHNTVLGNVNSGISIESCTETEAFGPCRGVPSGVVVPVVSNNRSGGNGAHGIFLRIGEDAVVQNNVVFNNAFSGIALRGVSDATVVNNLVYRNTQEGVAVGTGYIDAATSGDPADFSSPNTIVLNNTIYQNDEWGIEVGSSLVPSPGSAVVNNIVWGNSQGSMGIGVLNERRATASRQPSVCSYVSGFNDMLDDYGPDTPRNNFDIRADPHFVDLPGPDGVLGGEVIDGQFVDRSADDDFHLAADSPAIDAGYTTVMRLGLTGSTSSDGAADSGGVDLGYHYDAESTQAVFYEAPYMPLYVRVTGDNTNDGLSPAGALNSITSAAARAGAGVTVVVGPGTYRECNIHPREDNGRVFFVADPAGAQTGDSPGVVLVDAGKCSFDGTSYHAGESGFGVSKVCGVVIDGFHITGATDDGVQLNDQCARGIVRNTVVFSNGKRGINIINSDDVDLINNLLFANGGGVQVGSGSSTAKECADAGSLRVTLEFNTAYDNTDDGLLIGAGVCPSTSATLRYNITGENGRQTSNNGIQVGSNETRKQNLVGFTSGYNLIADSLASGVPQSVGDLTVDPSVAAIYLDPTAISLDGDWRLDQHFRLAQLASGQTTQSPAVDFSDVTAAQAGMATLSTRSDGVPDSGAADRGYHYPSSRLVRAGDCNSDGVVTIDEVIRAVNIAIGAIQIAQCPAADADGDGTVNIADLIKAVNAVLGN